MAVLQGRRSAKIHQGDGVICTKRMGIAPGTNDTKESVIGDEEGVGEKGSSGNRASEVTSRKPALNRGSIIGDTGRESDRVGHELERDGAVEGRRGLRGFFNETRTRSHGDRALCSVVQRMFCLCETIFFC